MDVLVIDSGRNSLRSVAALVELAGQNPFTAATMSQACKVLEEESIETVILDEDMGRDDSLMFMKRLRDDHPDLPVIVSTRNSTVEAAVIFIQNGAYAYLEKPFQPEHLKSLLAKLQAEIRGNRRVRELKQELSESRPEILLESLDEAAQYAYDIASKAAVSDANILLLGPSGNGKSVLAKEIHQLSKRADQPFITVSCPNLSGELLESELFGHKAGAFTGAVDDAWGKVHAAAGGTLFLDEIGELPLRIQPKLLRLLQEQEYERVGEARIRRANVRVISATNRDLDDEVKRGNFREDLLYRLNVISIVLPPIRERRSDLRRFAEHFLDYYKRRQARHDLKFSDSAIQSILDYDWPGNFRELSNVIERATILAEQELIRPEDLAIPIPGDTATQKVWVGGSFSLRELEAAHIRKVLEQSESIEKAAKVLGIDTATLYRKRKKMGLV